MSSEVPAEVVRDAAVYGVSIQGALRAGLSGYLARLLETNRAFNLTAVSDPAEAWRKHILDSLSLVPKLLERTELRSVIDVGSGGGLPGLPLALALPNHAFTLLEATGKKARFLTEVARELGLDNVRVVEARAESFGQGEGREAFDVVTSRAVSRLPVLLELTLPLVRVSGLCFALKGEQAALEVTEAARALKLLGGVVTGLARTNTGTIVSIEKTAPTPSKYPRRPGEPKRAPL